MRVQFRLRMLRMYCSEAPKDNFFLNTRADVPLKTEFKPAMKVLSRKPQAKAAPGVDSTFGLGQLSIEDDDEDEEEDARNIPLTAEERLLKTQREREEKQKKYEEARQRLFGKESASATTNLGSTTPQKVNTSNETKTQHRNKGSKDPRPSSSGAGGRQLYDPNYTLKPDSPFIQTKDRTPNSSGRSTPNEQQPIRSPRGPDNSGRGGFGFAPRGGRVN